MPGASVLDIVSYSQPIGRIKSVVFLILSLLLVGSYVFINGCKRIKQREARYNTKHVQSNSHNNIFSSISAYILGLTNSLLCPSWDAFWVLPFHIFVFLFLDYE